MRYIADSNGYIKEVSFGAEITCGGSSCVEYTGSVPSGYTSLEAWYIDHVTTLYKWKIVSGNLTKDTSATAPVSDLDIATLVTHTGTIKRLPAVYSLLEYTGLVTTACTTQEFMEAMNYNSVVHFTNNKERSVYLTDAPCSYGCATFQKGWTNYNCTGTIVDPYYGYVYVYKYAEGRNNNGWRRMGFGWRTLWTNSSPSSSFEAQTLTIDGLSDYNLFTIICQRNTSTSYQSSLVMYVPSTDETYGCVNEASVSSSGTSTSRQRNVFITRSANTVEFSTGWMTGSASGNSSVLIPRYILGVKI